MTTELYRLLEKYGIVELTDVMGVQIVEVIYGKIENLDEPEATEDNMLDCMYITTYSESGVNEEIVCGRGEKLTENIAEMLTGRGLFVKEMMCSEESV